MPQCKRCASETELGVWCQCHYGRKVDTTTSYTAGAVQTTTSYTIEGSRSAFQCYRCLVKGTSVERGLPGPRNTKALVTGAVGLALALGAAGLGSQKIVSNAFVGVFALLGLGLIIGAVASYDRLMRQRRKDLFERFAQGDPAAVELIKRQAVQNAENFGDDWVKGTQCSDLTAQGYVLFTRREHSQLSPSSRRG